MIFRFRAKEEFYMTLNEKVKTAIKRLKAFEPETESYYLCYSGGKDSDCIRILAHLAGVKHEIHHSLTTVDAPETIRYIKSVPGVIIDHAHDKNGNPITMWSLIEKKHIPPTMFIRYCCNELKERRGKGRFKITGVRKAESIKRRDNGGLVKIIGMPKTVRKIADDLCAEYSINKYGGLVLNDDNDESRRLVESCYRTTSSIINPIIDWEDDDVWNFLHYYGCRSNPLYECGKNRIGCIGCPMQGHKNMKKEFTLNPKYRNNYIKAFDRMLLNMPDKKNMDWRTGLDVYKWWVGDDPNQLSFFEEV